jgi:hypothetical protein
VVVVVMVVVRRLAQRRLVQRRLAPLRLRRATVPTVRTQMARMARAGAR